MVNNKIVTSQTIQEMIPKLDKLPVDTSTTSEIAEAFNRLLDVLKAKGLIE